MVAVVVVEGDVYGRLTVIKTRAELKSSAYYHLCECECGNRKLVLSSNLTLGKTKSCGCLAREVTSRRASTHGMSKTAEYATWNRMWSRCTNPLVDRYPQYGGRGISVCEEWRDFETFYSDMGPRPSKLHSIGRKDNDGNYCKDNCRWETAEQQHSNMSRNVYLEHEGVRLTIAQWSKRSGIPYATLIQRYRAKMPAEKILEDESLTKKFITVDGVTKLTTEWMKEAEIPISSFYRHLRSGMSKEKIVRKYMEKKFTTQDCRQGIPGQDARTEAQAG